MGPVFAHISYWTPAAFESKFEYSDIDIFEAVVVVNIISRHSNLSNYLVTHDLIVMESAQVESQAWFWQIPMTPIPQSSAWQISCEKYFLTDFEFHDLADWNTADLCPQCWSVLTVSVKVHQNRPSCHKIVTVMAFAIKSSQPCLARRKFPPIIVTKAPRLVFTYPASSTGQICVRLTDTLSVTWCDREMECWWQCLRHLVHGDHQWYTIGAGGPPGGPETPCTKHQVHLGRSQPLPCASTFARVPRGKHVVTGSNWCIFFWKLSFLY